MKRRPFLPGVSPSTRAIFFMLAPLLPVTLFDLWLRITFPRRC